MSNRTPGQGAETEYNGQPNTATMQPILPDRETARRNEWNWQVQWVDEGRPCFHRVKFGRTADAYADKLRKEGQSPEVFDLTELLQLH